MAATAFLLAFALALLPHLSVTPARAVSPRMFKPKSLLVHARVGVRNVALAAASLQLPRLIPLLHGNSIVRITGIGNHFHVFHSPSLKTQFFPLQPRFRRRNVGGFVFKESTALAYPVPMENSMLVVRLASNGRDEGVLSLWLVSHGVYTTAQRKRQRLFTDSLVREFADNAQRALGVNLCPRSPTVSGLCNNERDAHSGSSLFPLLTVKRIKRPSNAQLQQAGPNPRLISNKILNAHGREIVAPNRIGMLLVFFGQFLDHDMVLSPSDRSDRQSFIPIVDPASGARMGFSRSAAMRYEYAACCATNFVRDEVWKHPSFNILSSFIDGGAVYGSSHLRSRTLRQFRDGKLILKQRDGELFLPFNKPGDLLFRLNNEPDENDPALFVAGDMRANENIFLTSVHTLFAREHNRICDLLKRRILQTEGQGHRFLSDEWLYQNARKVVAAEIQSIVYDEFIPLFLGPRALKPYKGYDAGVDARISVVHAGAAFRWGHSAIWDTYHLIDKAGKREKFLLKDLFFTPSKVSQFGVDNLLKSTIFTPANDVNEEVVDSLRNLLFHPLVPHVMDLVALNIHRGRDLGLPKYFELQRMFKTGSGLENIRPELRDKLKEVYGNVENIDAFVGGLCETKVNGGLVGPLFMKINKDQFERLRDGDRFYYENVEWGPFVRDLKIVHKIKAHKFRIADVIFKNTNIKSSDFKEGASLFQTDSHK